MAMLSFDVRTLEHGAATVDAVLPPDDGVWMDEDSLRPIHAGIHVTGRLSAAGAGRFYFSGHLAGEVRQECRRCLTPVESAVDADVHVLYAASGGEDDADPDVYPLGGDVRYRVTAGGRRILETRQLHNAIIEFTGAPPKPGSILQAGTHAAVRDDIPEDTDVLHVLVRQPAVPEYIATNAFVYRIDVDGSIHLLGRRTEVFGKPEYGMLHDRRAREFPAWVSTQERVPVP